MSHQRTKARTEEETSDWEFRKGEVEELLQIYQNAKCVITRRLHVCLPCLAMEVPVLCVFPDKSSLDRMEPYTNWLHFTRVKEFLNGGFDYDILNPIPNKNMHLRAQKKLVEQMGNFVEEAATLENAPVKTRYTEEEKIRWQNQIMKTALRRWQKLSKEMHSELTELEKTRALSKRK